MVVSFVLCFKFPYTILYTVTLVVTVNRWYQRTYNLGDTWVSGQGVFPKYIPDNDLQGGHFRGQKQDNNSKVFPK